MDVHISVDPSLTAYLRKAWWVTVGRACMFKTAEC